MTLSEATDYLLDYRKRAGLTAPLVQATYGCWVDPEGFVIMAVLGRIVHEGDDNWRELSVGDWPELTNIQGLYTQE